MLLLARDAPGDRPAGQEQLRASLAAATELGMVTIASETRSLLVTVSV